VEGIFLAGLISLTSVGVLAVVLIRGDIRLNLSRKRLRSLLAYGAPLVPASLAFWALSSLDRMLLTVLRGQEVVGLYAVGSKVAAIAAFVTFALTQAYVPLSYELATRSGQERAYGRILLAYVAGMGALAVALAAFGPEIVDRLAAPDYAGGAAVVPWLVAGVALSGAGSILATGIHLAKRTVWVTVVALAAAATNLALNAWWIPGHGMIGAAAATLASYALMDLLLISAAQRLHPLPFPWIRAGTLAALAATGIVAGTWIEPWWGRALVVLTFAAAAALAARGRGRFGNE
jgi:O-antigen/teichoic acid export membrane protein